MKNKLIHFIKTQPVFFLLLPVFFVLHGFNENYDFVPVKDSLLLTGLYMGASLCFFLLAWLLYRNIIKAGLFTFCVMSFHFFFGSVYDWLKKIAPDSFIVKYAFLLPAALILFIALIIILKKTKRPLVRVAYFLNVLLLLLVLSDAVWLTNKVLTKKEKSISLPAGFSDCNDSPKPDIYFILADEYAGNTELKDQFHFDDSAFLNQLTDRRFHTIPNSHSNYNYTPFSLASMLNMEYLDLKGKDRSRPDLTYCYEKIRDSKLLQFLLYNKYDFYNYSVFDFEGQPARTRETFLAAKTRLITSQTFLSRFDRDIRFNLVTRWKIKSNEEILTYANKKNNDNIYDLTWKVAEKKTTSPKFIYTHLMLPHYPYFYDEKGNEQPFEKLQEGYQSNQEAYIKYLQYGNKKLMALVDHIVHSSASPPIILLMGDHGFRHFTKPVEQKYYFLNLSSIYLPSGNYTGFYDSISTVNQFRVLLNNQFKQQLPLLKDSTSYLLD